MNKNLKSKIITALTALLGCFLMEAPAPAFETGMLIDQELRFPNLTPNVKMNNISNDSIPMENLYYHLNAALWFSAKTTSSTSFFIKGSFDTLHTALFGDADSGYSVPQLDEAEFSFFPADIFFINFGRTVFKDPTQMIANGSYDGLNAMFNYGESHFKLSTFYTGLLTNKTAKLALSPSDRNHYFTDEYFALPHLMFSAYYDYVSKDKTKNFSFNILRQWDLKEEPVVKENPLDPDSKDKPNLQSMYFILNGSLMFWEKLNVNGGMSFCIANDGADHYYLNMYMNGFYMFDFLFPSRVGLGLSAFYGNIEEPGAMPTFNKYQIGYIYNPEAARIFALNSQYLVNLNSKISVEADLSMYFRMDTGYIPSYYLIDAYENQSSSGVLLGSEFVFNMVYSIFSDISLNLGCGLFMPGGSILPTSDDQVYSNNTPPEWDIRLGIIISL